MLRSEILLADHEVISQIIFELVSADREITQIELMF
jgi:hypothetical protein